MAGEYVYEVVLHLPFGWKLMRLRPALKKFIGYQYKSPILYKRVELPDGKFKEIFIPEKVYKNEKANY